MKLCENTGIKLTRSPRLFYHPRLPKLLRCQDFRLALLLTHALQRSGLRRQTCSLDHLVSSQQNRLRNGEPKRLGGLEIDD